MRGVQPKLNRAFPGAALAPSPDDTSRRVVLGNALATGSMVPQPINRLAPQLPPGGNPLAVGSLTPPAPASPLPLRAPTLNQPPPSQPPPSPMGQLAAIIGGQQFSTRELTDHAKRLLAAVRIIEWILRHPTITPAVLASAEQRARTGGTHTAAVIDAFLRRLPPPSDQAQLRAMLEHERDGFVKQQLALHREAAKRGVDLAGLVSSDRVSRGRGRR